MHCEASPLLYSNNRFGFSDLEPTLRLRTTSAVLTSFLSQIGRQNASFLRYICIDFSDFNNYQTESAMLEEDSISTLELICDHYTNIATFETLVYDTFRLEYANYKLNNPPIAAEVLDLLDARFRAISSLKEVIVDVYIYDDNGLSDDLRKKMCDYGWTIKVTKLGKLKKNKYANYEDYLKMKREEEREAERRDPYWKKQLGLQLNIS